MEKIHISPRSLKFTRTISAFRISGDKTGQWFEVYWNLKEFFTYLEKGSMANFKVYAKNTIFRKQIMIIIQNLCKENPNYSSSHCVLFDAHEHWKMNSVGYSSYGFDYDMKSNTITDKIISVFESIRHPEYEEIKKQEYSKSD